MKCRLHTLHTPEQMPVAWKLFLPEHSYLDHPSHLTLQWQHIQLSEDIDLPERPNAFVNPTKMIPGQKDTLVPTECLSMTLLWDLTMVLMLLHCIHQNTCMWLELRVTYPGAFLLDHPRNITRRKNNVSHFSLKSWTYQNNRCPWAHCNVAKGLAGIALPEHPNAFLSPTHMIPGQKETLALIKCLAMALKDLAAWKETPSDLYAIQCDSECTAGHVLVAEIELGIRQSPTTTLPRCWQASNHQQFLSVTATSKWARNMKSPTKTCNGMLMATAWNFEKSLASQSPWRVDGLGH